AGARRACGCGSYGAPTSSTSRIRTCSSRRSIDRSRSPAGTSCATSWPPPAALAGLLRSMADDEFVIGFSDSEWTGIAPLLEEDVAMSSLAQDELGHAAALYGLLGTLTDADPDALAYDREPD